MKNIDAEILKNEPIFWSRLGYGTDPPRRDENGSLRTAEPVEIHSKYHRDMAKLANVKIHTATVCLGWMGENKYDYDACDRTLDELYKNNEDFYFIPRVKLNAPIDWCRDNPSELWVYPDGPRSEEEIRALVGTEKHDVIGVTSSGKLIARQSFCSDKWRKDVLEALRRFIEHVESKPYADKIIGYHIGYGKAGETHPWCACGENGDFGISARKHFYNWALDKYKTIDALEKRWGVTNINPKNVPVPTKEDFERSNCDLKEFFYGDNRGALCYDYTLFMEETHIRNITALTKLIKEKTGKFAGIFHGYVMHSGANFVGHTDLSEVLEIPTIDFIAAPKSYYRYEAGEPCTSYCVPMSVNRKKLWLEEIDIRTYLSQLESEGVNRKAASAEETNVILWREFARCTMAGSGLWWMDLGGGWYDDKAIMDELRVINDLKRSLETKPKESISQILMVVDDKVLRNVSADHSFHLMCLQHFVCEMNLIGAPSDVYCMRDLDNINLSKYKVVAFLNAFDLTQEKLAKIKEKMAKNVTIIWNYTPGIIGETISLSNTEKLTGFKLKECENSCNFPYVEIIDAEKEILSYKDLKINHHSALPELLNLPESGTAIAQRKAEDGTTNVLAALPELSAKILYEIVKNAGVNMVAPLGCSVYGDSRFVGIFSSTDIDGKLNILGDAIDIKSGEQISGDDNKLQMKAKEMKLLLSSTND